MAIQGINNNGFSLNMYNSTTRATRKTAEKLSSGKQINSAADDASGLAISMQLTAQETQYSVGQQNAQSGIGLIRTSDGALNEVGGILDRMQELTLRSASGLYNDSQKAMLQQEFSALTEELDRIAQSTNYNGIQTLNGENGENVEGGAVGISTGSGENVNISVYDMTTKGLGLDQVNILGTDDAATALDAIANARDMVSMARGDYGAYENRLDHTINSLGVAQENTVAARSQIEDADIADQVMKLKANNIQSAFQNSLMDQANKDSYNILRWVQG